MAQADEGWQYVHGVYDSWELVAQTTFSFDYPQTIVGLSLSSHEMNEMASADYTGVQVSNTVV